MIRENRSFSSWRIHADAKKPAPDIGSPESHCGALAVAIVDQLM